MLPYYLLSREWPRKSFHDASVSTPLSCSTLHGFRHCNSEPVSRCPRPSLCLFSKLTTHITAVLPQAHWLLGCFWNMSITPCLFTLALFFFFLECSSLHISSRFVLYHQRGISYPHHLSNRMLPTFLLFILLDFFSPFISISIPDIMICICLVVYMMSPPTRMSTFREQEFCMFYSLLHLIV